MENGKKTSSPRKQSVKFSEAQPRTITPSGKPGLKRRASQQTIKPRQQSAKATANANNSKNVTIIISEDVDKEKAATGNGPEPGSHEEKSNEHNKAVEATTEQSEQNLSSDVMKADQEPNPSSSGEKTDGRAEDKFHENKATEGGNDGKVESIEKNDQAGKIESTNNAANEIKQQNVPEKVDNVVPKQNVLKKDTATDNPEASERKQTDKSDNGNDSGSKGKEQSTAKRGVNFAKREIKATALLKVPDESEKVQHKKDKKFNKTKMSDHSNHATDAENNDSAHEKNTSKGSNHPRSTKVSISEGSDAEKTKEGRVETKSPSVQARGGQRFMEYYNEILQKKLRDNPIVKIPRRKSPEVKEESSSESDTGSEDRESSLRPPSRTRNFRFRHDDDDHHVFNIKWHRQYLLRRKSIGEEAKKAMRRQEVLKKFQKKARIIIYCFRCVKDHCFRFRERIDLAPYMNTLENIDYMNEKVSDLMFDRSLFRAKRQMRMPDEITRILSTEKMKRSESEVYTAMIALRNIKSFASLPVRMQRLIAQAGVYERYEPRRVITREGHPPTSFYFILSGAVVAMQMDPEQPIAKRLEDFVKGDTFEERVMIYESPRTMTTLTKETCEFLSISMADFQEIYMQDGVKTLNDPDMGLFLRRLSCLEGWPLEILKQHPKEFRFRHFKNGTAITDDTKLTEWLIIVKSGSIAVLKKLKKVGPYDWKKQGLKALTEKERRDRDTQKAHWRRYVLQELRCPLKQKNEFEEIEERVDGKPKPFQHPDIKVQIDDTSGGRKYYYPNLWTIKSEAVEEDDGNKGATNFSNINKQYLYVMSGSSKQAGQKTKPADRNAKSAKVTGGRPNRAKKVQRPCSEKERRPPAVSPASDISLRSILNSPALSLQTTSTEFEERVHQIAASIDINLEPLSDADINPQFVKVQTLTKGDVWGLANLILDEQPSFMVVSNGADCVLLNKDFYMQHCPDKLLRKMEQNLCPYPSDDNMQESLQVRVDWHDYRRCELSATIATVSGIRQQKTNQPTPNRPVCT